MIKRLFLGVIISILVVVLPTLGNAEMLRAPHLWILILLGILASIFQPSYNPFTITFKPRDKWTGAQIIWSVYLTQLAAIVEATYLRYPVSVQWDATATIAIGAAVLGLSLRTWAVLTLGSLFTMHIDVQEGHTVVQKGPYRIVRHPSYLGAFIMYVATCAFLHAWYSLVVAVLILPFAFLRRIRYEEELLKDELGADYETYSQKVKKIVPGIW
jgi:protein-S-isoprenylcysteine O-methyltransferase